MKEFTFAQLVDPVMVRHLLEAHQLLSGMAYGLFDPDGNSIVSVGWQDICERYHRVHPITCLCCRESNAYIMAHLHEAVDSFVEYRCPNGMIDAAMPIMIDGKLMATFFVGQFFFDDDPIDREFFIAQAAEMGFDHDDYLAALDQVPRLSRDQVRDIMLSLRDIVRLLTWMGAGALRCLQDMKEGS